MNKSEGKRVKIRKYKAKLNTLLANEDWRHKKKSITDKLKKITNDDSTYQIQKSAKELHIKPFNSRQIFEVNYPYEVFDSQAEKIDVSSSKKVLDRYSSKSSFGYTRHKFDQVYNTVTHAGHNKHISMLDNTKRDQFSMLSLGAKHRSSSGVS